MKRVFILLVSLFAMMAASMSAMAQEVTITLTPGWNWISYPNAEAMQVGEALGDFVPMEGDRIRSKFGMSSYGGGRWRGAVTHFIPGWGYMYYSVRTESVEFSFERPSSTSVATATPTDITATSAVVGGMVILPEGAHVFLRGVCWGTASSPDIDGDHTTEGMGIGSFNSTLEGLNPNTTYYVRAYAVSDHGLAYGSELCFTTMSGIPTVSTAEVTDITVTTATCGGTIATDGGLAITARGVCWSTNHNPTLSDSHTTDGTGTGSFTSSLTGLSASTTYYVRAYATNAQATYYGGEMIFTTLDYGYVDLGLPSGLLWATCNMGADNPEDYGDYFAWGETQPKDYYDWSTYQYCNGNDNTMTKYCNNSSYGYNGYTDNLTTLLPEDDAATVNWGADWRMPTIEEWQELYNTTTVTWTIQNGVNGRLFTASNGNSLFLPAAGVRSNSGLDDAGSSGFYWSSSLYTINPNGAWRFFFDLGNCYMGRSSRFYGRSVRPVRSAQNTAPTGAINGKFTINENGDQVYFSQGNLQYQASTNTWRFAEYQYDYIGSDNSNISSTYDGWIDLFGWGTSGYNHGANAYQPWNTSQSPSDYYAYGSETYNLYDQTGQADWGYNAISNGGSATNQWRTLTGGSGGEWDYVFNTRITTSGIRYAKAQVNNVNGVILLPDDWSESYYSLSDTNNGGAGYGSNVISASNWTSSLQSHGAVFLPAAGYRCGTSVNGGNGCYWSASYKHSLSSYDAGFSDSGLGTAASQYVGRCDGQSVRLVRVAEN